MPSISTMRTPLGLINRNITRGKELTPKLRNKICALAENNHDIPFIIGRYKVSRELYVIPSTTKSHALKLIPLHLGPVPKKTYNYLDKRNLLYYACQNPKQTYTQLKKTAGVSCTYKIIYYILQGNSITNWITAKYPLLTKKAVKARYK
jgi:hypothetical protein